MNAEKIRTRKERTPPNRPSPSLRFTPYSWAKLSYLRDRGITEIGGFAVSAATDLLLIEDLCLVEQHCSKVTVEFDDAAVADHFDRLVDQGMQPERFARIWIHTHPGDSPLPSGVDEETFARVFGRADWAVMAIVARNDATYARLWFRAGAGWQWEIPVTIDYRQPFPASEAEKWEEEYRRCVIAEDYEDLFDWDGAPADWPYEVAEWEEYQHEGTGRGSV